MKLSTYGLRPLAPNHAGPAKRRHRARVPIQQHAPKVAPARRQGRVNLGLCADANSAIQTQYVAGPMSARVNHGLCLASFLADRPAAYIRRSALLLPPGDCVLAKRDEG
jgi:hypothetical protein